MMGSIYCLNVYVFDNNTPIHLVNSLISGTLNYKLATYNLNYIPPEKEEERTFIVIEIGK